MRSRLARGARRIRACPAWSAELDKNLPLTGLAMLGEEPQRVHVQFPWPVAQHPGSGRGGRRARIVHDQARTRRHRPACADDHAGAGRDHAVAEFRDAAGRERLRHDPDQDRQGRHQEHRASRASRFRPTPTASFGCITRTATPRSMSRPSTCWTGACRRKRSRGKLVLIGTSSVGLNDIKTTPVSPAMPGVEIHAQVLESALTGAVLSQPNYGIALEFFGAPAARTSGDRVCAELRAGHAGRLSARCSPRC